MMNWPLILTYFFLICCSGSSGGYNLTTVRGEGEGELLIGSLSKFTRYSIVVQAYNQVGQGPMSEPIPAQTYEDGK